MGKKYSGSIFLVLSALTVLFGVVAISIMVGCGGGGDPIPKGDRVTISGTVDDGTGNSPIQGAVCKFYDMAGKLDEETVRGISGYDGKYNLYILPDKEGYIRCHPSGMTNLLLSNYISTKGMSAEDEITDPDLTDVNPTQSLVADNIDWLKPADKPDHKKSCWPVSIRTPIAR